MARYSVHSMLVSLNIQDTPLRYAPAYGPQLDFSVTYNQRDTQQPAAFNYSNLGPKWTLSWLSYVSDDPTTQLPQTSLYRSGGGAEIFAYDSASSSFVLDAQSHAILVKTGVNSYERRLPDGSKEVFAQSDGATTYPRRIFMTQMIDPAGNAVAIGYDSSFRIMTITDALGQVTTLSYELSGDPLKITKVTDPFGRFATFAYTDGKLISITDQIGIQSQFSYLAGSDFINSLTTPYGTTSFVSGENGTNRWIEMTDPLGGKERVEYRDQAPGINTSDPVAPNVVGIVNAGLDSANTFYWDKKGMEFAPGDYTKAKITHWLRNSDGTISGIAGSEKQPLENRVWYTYAGQLDYRHVGPTANPSQIARVLDDGTTLLSKFEYNSLGNTTKKTDPLGRVTSYIYNSNNIDLLEVRQTTGTTNDLLRKFTSNSQHEPLTDTDASGQTTSYTYNSFGQILTRQNAKNETTTFAYSGSAPQGYLASITSPSFNGSSAVTSFVYDSFKRVRTVTDSDGYAVTTDYDNLDRKVKITYPDNTCEQFQYTDNVTGAMTLDLTGSRDRRGLWTYRHYNANQQIDSITDPANRTTRYSWCTCGALESITDAKNQLTTFSRDLQGRLSQKTFANTKSVRYTYENSTSRLKSVTDAKNQVTNYQYLADNNLTQISYTDTAGQPLSPATPTVSFSYGANYDRLGTMVDGTGTTTYSYNPVTSPPSLGAGRLQSVDGPLANDTITYSYDELGRELGTAVNGIAASRTFDSLGRMASTTNPLGVFPNTHDGVSGRLQSTALPNGFTRSYSYFPTVADKRLQTIDNRTSPSALVSKFDYQYDPEGEITQLTAQRCPTCYPVRWFGLNGSMLDAADQLTNITSQTADDVYAGTSYSYDDAGNRTDGTTYTHNNVNQLTNAGYAYDANGNLTADPTHTYEWDAANRLKAINYNGTSNRTEFTYDGLGRRVKIVEKGIPVPVINFTAQPASTSYGTYASPSVSLAAGVYTLTIAGLNPNGGTNTGLVDAVKLNTSLVGYGGFEAPVLAAGSWTYAPAGWGWASTGSTGIAKNSSAVTTGNPVAPEGTQVGFIVNTGTIWKYLTVNTAGTYNLNLRAAQRGTTNTSFQRLSVKVQATAAAVLSTKQHLWNGSSPVEERDASNNVTRRFYPEGEQIAGASYYYTRDHLGSVREMASGTGAVRAQYDYDAWGKRTKLTGDLDASFGFTGQYYHAPSGLYLTLYRAYNPVLGRWLSRDPIGERGGINLYGYVGNDPTNHTDSLGLLVDAYLNEAQGIITIIDRDTGRGASFRGGAGADGTAYRNNWNEEGRLRLGPLPRGDYDILNRIQGGNSNLDGVPAWALDRKDRVPRDDIAQGYGRSAFRFHFGRSEGCVTTNDRNGFDAAANILNHTATQSVTDANGQRRTYYGDFHVFSGVGTAPAVFP